MFSRNSEKDGPRPAPAAQPDMAPTMRPPSGPVSAPTNGVSVIGNDLTIIGSGLRIIAQQPLQVDGEIQGDVMGTQVTIGSQGKVTGLVNADKVQINGTVNGTIRGLDVVLSSTANVEGDIYHSSITLEQGAIFEGRSRRPQDQDELRPNLTERPATGAAHGQEPPGVAETAAMPGSAESA